MDVVHGNLLNLNGASQAADTGVED